MCSLFLSQLLHPTLIKITPRVSIYFPPLDTVSVWFLCGSISSMALKQKRFWIFDFAVLYGIWALHAEIHQRRSECRTLHTHRRYLVRISVCLSSLSAPLCVSWGGNHWYSRRTSAENQQWHTHCVGFKILVWPLLNSCKLCLCMLYIFLS